MSSRNVAEEIQALAQLANVRVDEIQHFIAGVTDAGDISFVVPQQSCAVVVCVEQFNVDDSATNTGSRKVSGSTVTEVQEAAWNIGADLFYVFGPGTAAFTLNATPQGGKTYFARAVGYLLPIAAQARLERMSTKILS